MAINRPGEIWLRLMGRRAHPWQRQEDPKLSRAYLNDLLYIIANTYEMEFDPVRGSPVVYATLPGDHRFSAIAGRNVMYDHDDVLGGVAMAIRLHKDDVSWGLQDYGLKQGEKLWKINRLKILRTRRSI